MRGLLDKVGNVWVAIAVAMSPWMYPHKLQGEGPNTMCQSWDTYGERRGRQGCGGAGEEVKDRGVEGLGKR